MSRSYKKHPILPDNVVPGSKRCANKKVRRVVHRGDEETQNWKGKSYRKLYNSWNVHDYINYGGTFENFYDEAIRVWKETGFYPGRDTKRHDTPPSRKYCKNIYDRWYKRK